MTLAVALHESGAPPVLATVNCVCAATQVERVMLLGWTLRVAGTGVAVGAMVAVGIAPDGCAVAVGALEKGCEDELEFEEEELLEDAEGARMIWKGRWNNTAKSAATSKTASKAASAVPAPDANTRGTCGTCGVGQMAPRC